MRLSLLRGFIGKKPFDEAMDSFGKKHAGKAVTVAQFKDHFEKTTKQELR